jgi:hypothetical protein
VYRLELLSVWTLAMVATVDLVLVAAVIFIQFPAVG